jgi:protoporphyrinogen oxidase
MSDSASVPTNSYDLCVIGAGISGLCLARLAAGRLNLRTLVLEQRPDAGGCLASATLAEDAWLELGAHTCYNTYANFLEIMDGTGFLERAVGRKSMGFRLVQDGALASIPSRLSFLEAACSLPRLFTTKKDGLSAAEYYGRILGRRNWDRVVHPMLNAVASQETEGFPADALFKKRGSRRKDVLRSFAVRGGLGAAAQSLAAQPGIDLALGRGAAALERNGEGFQVRTQDGAEFTCRFAAVATPADAASGLLAGAFPELAAHLGRMETRLVRSLGVLFADPLPAVPRLAGLVLPGSPCFSAVSADTFPVPGKRAWTFHFDPRRMADDPESMLAFACQTFKVGRDQVAAHFRRDHVMPSVRLGHAEWLQQVDTQLRGGRLMLVGNYLDGLSIEDCAGRAKREFQRVLASA